MEPVKIVLLCILSAVSYGILHDQVTARVCVEYFTIGHPPVFRTESPTLLALGWGIIATWWVGLLLGIPAVAARLGPWPKATAANLVRPILVLLAAMAVASLSFGVIGYFAAQAGEVWLLEPLSSTIPKSKHYAFLANAWAQSAAYDVGFLGGIAVCFWLWIARHRTKAP